MITILQPIANKLSPFSRIDLVLPTEKSHDRKSTPNFCVCRPCWRRRQYWARWIVSAWRRGAKWEPLTNGLPKNPQVRALLIHPKNPKIIYAGTNQGPYRSDDRGDHWHPMGTPRNGMNVWSLAFQPHNTQVIYAGYEPFGIYRSEDGGQSWRETDTAALLSLTSQLICHHWQREW